ncbi:MAG: signal peptidase I [Candidatus Peribacteraceae bacterium]|nr:signal peptidase I [Candidatus Peribacteraceae bacterium]
MTATSVPRGILFHVFDVALNIIIIVAIVALIRTFVVSPFQIEGNSMVDTLEHKEYIVINKFRYFFKEPQRGDIVVFRPPTDHGKYYVKRVIGLPGETVVIRDGSVFIRKPGQEDQKLNEPYLNETNAQKTYRYPVNSGDTTEEAFPVPEGEFFLLGDNRQGSLDSRSFGHLGTHNTAFVPQPDIKGSVWFVALPITKVHAFTTPEYDL